MKTLNCHIFRTRHTRIPVFVLNWDLVTSILYTKNRAISSTELHGGTTEEGNCSHLLPRAAAAGSNGTRGEEGNCSYLLPLSHRETDKTESISIVNRCSNSEAFDLVNRHILFYKLMKQGYHGRVIDTLRSLYRKTYLVSTGGGGGVTRVQHFSEHIIDRSCWLFGEVCCSLYIRNNHGSSVVGRRFGPYFG